MAFFAIFLSVFSLPFSLEILPQLLSWTDPFHRICLSLFKETAHQSINSALICGENISDLPEHDRLVRAGLYHLVVVSGSHLAFLEKAGSVLLPRRLGFAIPFLLLIFCFVSGWQAPVVRSFFQSLGRGRFQNERTNLLHSWILCLALHPQWIHSLSLHLSVLASLALIPRRESGFGLALQVLFFLFPLLAGWSTLHPAVALIAVCLAPVSLVLWLTTAAIEFVKPDGFDLWNRLLAFWNEVLANVGNFQPPVERVSFSTRHWAWCFVLIMILGVHAFEIRRARKQKGLSV